MGWVLGIKTFFASFVIFSDSYGRRIMTSVSPRSGAAPVQTEWRAILNALLLVESLMMKVAKIQFTFEGNHLA